MDCLQTALKHETRSAKSETHFNAGNTGKLETQSWFAHFPPFRISKLFRVDFRISRIARWLLVLAGTWLACQVAYAALIVLIIWRLQAINLW